MELERPVLSVDVVCFSLDQQALQCLLVERAVDPFAGRWELPGGALRAGESLDEARRWCRDVKIVVTGGFAPDKIRQFEAQDVPVDIYGVGSWLLSNSSAEGTNTDFTADIVRVRVEGRWLDMAKTGRGPGEHAALEPVVFPAVVEA